MAANLSRRLYRLVTRATRELFRPESREFRLSAADVFQNDLMRLSHGEAVFFKLISKTPHQTLNTAFRDGVAADVDVLLSFLPQLLRYSKAIKLIHSELDSTYDGRSSRYSPYDMAPAALLISKMHYTEHELKERNLKSIYSNWMNSMVAEVKREIDRLSRNRSHPSDLKPLASLEAKRHQLFLLVLALNKVILQHESHRIKGLDYEYLLDQLQQPTDPYYRGMPITYSIAYSSLINKLDLDLIAFGVPFPKHFLTRVVPRRDPSLPTVSLIEIAKARPQRLTQVRSKLFTAPSDSVSISTLTGNYLCSTSDGKTVETSVRFDEQTQQLRAFVVDSATGRVDGDKPLWSLPIDSETVFTGLLKASQEYVAVLHADGLPPSTAPSGPTTLSPTCSVRFVGISPLLFGPKQYGVSGASGGFHYELQVTWTAVEEVAGTAIQMGEMGNAKANPAPTDASATVQEKREMDAFYCRVSELDWCMLDISDEGVVPVPALMYIDALNRLGYTPDDVLKNLEPVTRVAVAERMAGNMARVAIRRMGTDALVHSSFWSTVRRQLTAMRHRHTFSNP